MSDNSIFINAQFQNFLRSKGYNDNGIAEIEERVREGHPDREDLHEIKDYKNHLASEVERKWKVFDSHAGQPDVQKEIEKEIHAINAILQEIKY